uniref:Uncharacterized protein n=1 Tax=Arcella intermedia TaxID=1963864 RepID=A0A6B2LTG8_9EUKA
MFVIDKGISQHRHDGVPPQEQLRDKPLFVDLLRLILSLSRLRHLRPNLQDMLQDHVTVPIKGLHAADELLVVPDVYEDLCLIFDGLVENR